MDSPVLTLYSPDAGARELAQMRGVGWVLKWAGSIAAIVVAAIVLTSFAFQLAAERALARATAAGLREAALPRATSETVAQVVRQRLVAEGILARATKMRLEQNGRPLRGVIHANHDDQVAITLSMPAAAVIPRWLPMHAWLLAGDVEWRSSSGGS